ncbi:trans-2-enoyl-CoA reductase-like protein [Protomyces lactucae-debilis]|uniref:enoyl-[acyl-carrier-protein] reductase n=1 Tax=Protomyces lactucae-debilis TaxID=2754530 RepID=A0A1Y2F7D3_PROLT|nr:trans-2-enoyl-CoA reductase-like protein [Protomyces lactucae-debilis]ORY79557.1 trans-2-enoyl-CoA reductase-like protein [Protomyces lactucae-debilis]
MLLRKSLLSKPACCCRSLTSRAIVYSEHGDPAKVLEVHNYELPKPQDDELLVRFLASPINPADLNQIEGVYPKRPAFTDKFKTPRPAAVGGNEGLVEVIGTGKQHMSMKWQLGQWAIMRRTTFGTWRTHALAKEDDLLPVKAEGLSPVDVATVSINPCTAYRMLQDFAKLQKGSWWVQNGANSAVGQSAIQMGRIWGYKSLNIIRDRPGSDEVKQQLLDLGATLVITETQLSDKDFMKQLKREHFQDEPVTLALNCVGGVNAINMCRQLTEGAHIVTYGAMAKQPLKIPASMLIFKDFCFHGFWVSPWNDRHPDERQEMLEVIFDWMWEGQFRSPAAKLNWWEPGQSDAEALAVFRGALENKSQKQVLCIDY